MRGRNSLHITVPKWASTLTTGDRAATMTLWALCIHRRASDGLAWPSLATLSTHTGMSEQTVRRALRRLVAMGAIEVARFATRYTPTTYHIAATAGQRRGTISSTPEAPVRGTTMVPEPLYSTDQRLTHQTTSPSTPAVDPSPSARGAALVADATPGNFARNRNRSLVVGHVGARGICRKGAA